MNNEQLLAIRVTEAAAAFVRCQNDHNRDRLFAAMAAMTENADAECAREFLLNSGWSDGTARDGECWTHRAGQGSEVEIEVSDGEIWFYGFEDEDEVAGLTPAELRAFAVLAEDATP
jgi:hypothetical protein